MKTRIPLPECNGAFIEFDDAKISRRQQEKLIEAFESVEFRETVKNIIGTSRGFVTALEACRMLGYKTAKACETFPEKFARLGCKLTDGIRIGTQRRFIKSEIEAFIKARREVKDGD